MTNGAEKSKGRLLSERELIVAAVFIFQFLLLSIGLCWSHAKHSNELAAMKGQILAVSQNLKERGGQVQRIEHEEPRRQQRLPQVDATKPAQPLDEELITWLIVRVRPYSMYKDGIRKVTSDEAFRVLVSIGPPVVPALIKDATENGISPGVATLLGQIGTNAKEVVPLLGNGIGNRDSYRAAIVGLGLFGPDARSATADIGKVLDNAQGVGELGSLAAESLGRIGDPRAVPHLVQALRNRDARVRRAAIAALARIGPEGRNALPALRELIDKPSAPGEDIRAAGAILAFSRQP